MLWFTVWTILVLGTLTGAFFLGRDLWRKGKALLAELERAADLTSAFAERTEQLSAAAETAPSGPDILSARGPHRARLAALRAEREVRREARRLRHERTVLGWRAYTR